MVFVQQVVPCFVINFEVAYADLEFHRAVFLSFTEDVTKSPWYDTPVSVSFCPACNRKCFPRASLSICEDSAVVTIEAIINHITSHCIENLLLFRKHVEYSVVLKLVVVIFDFVVSETVSLEIKLDFPIVWSQTQSVIRLLCWTDS